MFEFRRWIIIVWSIRTGGVSVNIGFASPETRNSSIIDIKVNERWFDSNKISFHFTVGDVLQFSTRLPEVITRFLPGAGKYQVLYTDYKNFAILWSCSSVASLGYTGLFMRIHCHTEMTEWLKWPFLTFPQIKFGWWHANGKISVWNCERSSTMLSSDWDWNRNDWSWVGIIIAQHCCSCTTSPVSTTESIAFLIFLRNSQSSIHLLFGIRE